MAELMATIVVVLGDDPRIVGVLRRMHLDHRVVVQEVEQLLAAGGEAADDLALVQRLVLAGDHALSDQPHDAVGEHLGVDAQVVAVGQRGQHRVGDPADAELQRVAVGDQAGHVAGDLACRFVGLVDHRPLEQRLVVRDEVVDLADVEEAVAERAGHVRLTWAISSLADWRPIGHVHRDAQAAEAVLVRRADHDQATSMGSRPERNIAGICEKKIGV